MALNIKACLEEAIRRSASDFHIVVGIPPTLRVHGELVIMEQSPVTEEAARLAILGILNSEQKQTFGQDWELNFAYSLPNLGRFRVNVYAARGNIEAAFRIISVAPRNMTELGLPAVVSQLCKKSSGLILITGPAGQGKTTTMASMINQINREGRKCRMVTIEDPIEYLHENINSVVVQREVGIDTKSFNTALMQSLRQDPNIICIGEMRDLETIGTALTAAETGHLVMGTLHAPDAAQCIDRIIDVFPAGQQQQIRIQLASSLEGVLSQKLLPRKNGNGRVVAVEVLIGTSAVKNIIRDRKTELLYGVMQTGSAYGMVLMDAVLKDLYEKDVISLDTALSKARDPKAIKEER